MITGVWCGNCSADRVLLQTKQRRRDLRTPSEAGPKPLRRGGERSGAAARPRRSPEPLQKWGGGVRAGAGGSPAKAARPC